MSAKWSIPGNAIFAGAVINLFIAVFSFQVLSEGPGEVKKYYILEIGEKDISAISLVCFALSAFYTAAHAVLLLRMRTFLDMPQLRLVCLYKLAVNFILPFFWLPDLDPRTDVNEPLTFAIRGFLFSTYLFGFLGGGLTEGVSSILSSEKED